MQFLVNNQKFSSQEQNDWFHRAMLDKDMNDILMDRIIIEETEAEAVAKRRYESIFHLKN